MIKRLFDIVCSILALISLLPVLIIAMVGITVSSKGPIFYKAKRVGKNGVIFHMHKFRTMHIEQGTNSLITSANDNRVFKFGLILRKLKIDELPQLIDVLRGKMSIIGPRPEDPTIVEKYYDSVGFETLKVLPGLASPGSIYNYTHGERLLVGKEIEKLYSEQLLPIKLAIDYVYVKNHSFLYDIKIILRTLLVILLVFLGKKDFFDPIEMNEAILTIEKKNRRM
jgi:lipopolysaccharide/colanic/teichoic acid biosynthesis glycosyltransferase